MKRIVLVRHGQSTWNLDRRFCGWSDPDLSELGRWQAEQLAESFNECTFDTVWASDLKRAKQTAQLAWGHHQTDPRLREIHFGDLEGRTWLELPETLRTALKDFSSFAAPGGETAAEFRERIVSFCEDLTDGTHLVFCHGGVIRVLLAELDVNEFVANASIAEITWSPRALVRLVAGPQRDAT